MDAQAVEILIRARILLDTPEKHTTGFYARDADGHPCDVETAEAAKFCLSGAIQRSRFDLGLDPSIVAFREAQAIGAVALACEELYENNLLNVNDDIGYAAVILVLDRAIEIATA